MSFIGDIIKMIIAYRLITSPLFETAVLCGSILLLLFFGAFVRFKNGWLSWICYAVLIGVPITLLTIKVVNVNLPVEDMQLSDVRVEKYIEANGDGIVFKKYLRRTLTEPLVGIQPIKDQQRIDDFVNFINNKYPNNIISYKTSKKYRGIVLVDSSGKDMNIALISDGFVQVSDNAPMQYLTAASNARSRLVGIYASPVGLKPAYIEEFTFYAMCFFLGYYAMYLYQRYKKSSFILRVTLIQQENQNGKEKECNQRSDNRTNSSGGTGSRKDGGDSGGGDSGGGDRNE